MLYWIGLSYSEKQQWMWVNNDAPSQTWVIIPYFLTTGQQLTVLVTDLQQSVLYCISPFHSTTYIAINSQLTGCLSFSSISQPLWDKVINVNICIAKDIECLFRPKQRKFSPQNSLRHVYTCHNWSNPSAFLCFFFFQKLATG